MCEDLVLAHSPFSFPKENNMNKKESAGINLISVISFLNFIGGFIITMYNVYSVLSSIKDAKNANKKTKTRRFGFYVQD